MRIGIISSTLLMVFSCLLFAQNKVALKPDFSEADAVIDILNIIEKNENIDESHWQNLFNKEAYQKLKRREASLNRSFTDEDFKRFISTGLYDKKETLYRTLNEWKKAKFDSIAASVVKYLPVGAAIEAKVFVVIKPKQNSFIWQDSTGKNIFLYLDTTSTKDRFENTLAHESHHIGMMSLEKEIDVSLKYLPPAVKKAIDWLSAFGEGQAMLAAAGSPARHPHWCSADSSKERWDKDMLSFNSDLKNVEKLFLNILNGTFSSDEEIMKAADSFWGYQGAWYTVGYKMAALIENEFGQEKLVSTFLDQRNFLFLYNKAANIYNHNHEEKLALWSEEIIEKLKR